jgi:cell division septal protein FtsQ
LGRRIGAAALCQAGGAAIVLNQNPIAFDVESPRAGFLRRRRGNRRVAIQRRSLTNAVAGVGVRVGRASLRVGRVVGKLVLLLSVIAACGWGGRWAVRHVVDSPRFQIREIDFSPTPHLDRAAVLRLASVSLGDRLLGVDTDAVAARIATHPWVATARTSRRLPSSLVIEVTERRAVAVAALSGLYLVDETGRPFKRATMDEADGLPVLTGIDRARYAQMRDVSEAAFREALAVLRQYRDRPGRPPVGEVDIDPGYGFSLFLVEGGAEIRLGRGNYGKKLAQLDQILEAVLAKGTGGLSILRIVHLDLPESGRIPVLLRTGDAEPSAPTQPETVKIAKN